VLTSNIRTADCRYGRLAFFEDDEFIGKSLAKYGEYSDLETELWCQLELDGKTVIDVGANIGALTVALSDIVGADGHVFAFEPQPQNAGLLRRNVACLEVTIEEVALGAAPGTVSIPFLFDLEHKNYGRVELGSGDAVVDVRTLDSYNLAPAFIKIDVEGYELDVLLGARATIERHQPLLYVENDREDKAADLIKLI
jgi:FkbM family methyltransferase